MFFHTDREKEPTHNREYDLLPFVSEVIQDMITLSDVKACMAV